MILEPVQGEGGFVPAPVAYLKGLRELCHQHGILLILDEVQSGFCRTGRWAAYEHYDVLPDISTWAKSMGGGLPIGAVMGRAEVMDAARARNNRWHVWRQSSRLRRFTRHHQVDGRAESRMNVRSEIGKTVAQRLRELQSRFPSHIGDVRGLGAMVGVEFVHEGSPHAPAADLTSQILKACVSRGLLILGAGIHGNVIRFLMPLVISDRQLNDGLDIVTQEIVKAIENE